jgi:hypothetical protein
MEHPLIKEESSFMSDEIDYGSLEAGASNMLPEMITRKE